MKIFIVYLPEQKPKQSTQTDLYKELKEYRLRKSKEENLKAFMIFTNEMLDALTNLKPKSKEELLTIKGFGVKKVEQYGDEILFIINR